MTLSRKHLQQLKSTIKRRAMRPASSYEPPATLKISRRDRDRITRTNPTLLLGLESLIVNTWKVVPELDDHDVEQALTASILGKQLSDDGPAQQLAQALQEKSEIFNGDAAVDEDWMMALRTILDSVQTRREARESRSYLIYAREFVAAAKRKLE